MDTSSGRACAQGRVELVCDAEGVCSGKSPTNMANVDVAYGALKMTCTSKKAGEFTDAHVGESTWGGHIDLGLDAPSRRSFRLRPRSR